MPTVLLVSTVVAVVALFVTIRVLLGMPAAQEEEASEAAAPSLTVITAETPASSPAEASASPQAGIRFTSEIVEPSYTVAPGDNLWSIARRHNVSVEALQAINSLPDQTTLRVGQRLVIP
jgi:LysM repeat protein